MKLDYKVNPYIPVTKQRHLVYALIEIAPSGAQAPAPAPLNLGLVVDASRSMSIPILSDAQFAELRRLGMARQVTVDGVRVWQIEVPKNTKVDAPSNMDFTKQALAIVADYLQPADRFSLVAFAQDALLMVHNSPGTQKKLLLEAVDRLDQIDLGDETYMARGMEKGYEQILPGLSPDRVNRMIVLTDGYTKEEHACYEWARTAKQKGVVVSTMGLGLDFNENLLISLADASGGNAYFIDEPSDIPNAFRQELSELKSVTWRDLSLSLALPTDITLRRAHRVRPAIAALDVENGRIALGDLQSNQPPSILLELVVPPRPAGNYRLAQVSLHGRAAGSQQAEPIASQDILIRYSEKTSQATQSDADLMSAVQRVSAVKLQTQAIEEAERGNVAGATRRLRTAGERLIEMGQDDLGQTMLVEAELMEKEGQMSAEGTKKLRYGTRKLSRSK
jgi:Ca-activated chloride channel family protein